MPSTTLQSPSSQTTTTTTTELLPALLVGGASAAAAAAAAAAYYAYRRHCQIVQRLAAQAEERRKEERTGRIRAEVKLRTLYREKEALEVKMMTSTSSTGSGDDTSASAIMEGGQSMTTHATTKMNVQDKHRMVLQCIGTVVSPYTKRMGTPRQGSLVPSSRAFVDLTIPVEALDGIGSYSHVWIIFAFHVNTNTFHKKTKVRPPRATDNQKVGQLATRSPHRPNPLGLSLVKMERLDTKLKRLHISGIDLVHGTPVYDIKPCVPWDIPGHFSSHTNGSSNDNSNSVPATLDDAFWVPDWVDQKDAIATVTFTEQAETSLEQLIVDEQRLAPLYTKTNGGVQAARATLLEILAQDPRSSHKGLKVNQRGSTTKTTHKTNDEVDNKTYSLVFGRTQVEFQVLSSGVQVESVTPVDFDEDAYVEGIPLISEQKNQMK